MSRGVLPYRVEVIAEAAAVTAAIDPGRYGVVGIDDILELARAAGAKAAS